MTAHRRRGAEAWPSRRQMPDVGPRGRGEVLGPFADEMADEAAPEAISGTVGRAAVDHLAGEDHGIAGIEVDGHFLAPGRDLQ